MRESEIEKYLRKRVRDNDGLCWKFVSPGTAGVPDRIVVLKKRIYFVELKAPSKRMRKLQEYRRAQLEASGQLVLLVDTKSKVEDFIKAVMTDEI